MTSTVTINGRTFIGKNITITGDGVVAIDGVVQDGEALSGIVEVRVLEGVINHLTCPGSVTCGDVTGNVDAGTHVVCGNVGGDVDAGTSVTCGSVNGDVDAGTSIRVGT